MRLSKIAAIEQLEKRILLSLSVVSYDPANPTSGLTTALLSPSSGITQISAATFTGGNGQAGTFTGFNLTSGPNTLAIADGILLTSGLAGYAQGAPSGGSKGWSSPGDSNLSTLIGNISTHDANILTLTFTTSASAHSISFDLIFGSNESPGDSTYRDVFGAFLDGTQISLKNALPIDVGSSPFSYENDGGSGHPGTTAVNMPVGYDWLTGKLTTTAALNTGITTHTLKLAIADGTDTTVDTGVFLSHLETDTAGSGSFQVNQSTGTIANTGGSVNVVVDRMGGSTGSTTVDYATSDGTASAGTDYNTTTGTLTFADGDTSKTISIPILDNTSAAASSTFALALSNATGGASLASGVTDTITILNTQSALQLAAATYSFANTAGSATLTVNRTGDTSSSATVQFATSDGTAVAGSDYTSTSAALTFSAGQASKTISVPLLANAAGAASSTFAVTLTSPGGNGVLGAQTISTVTETNANSSLQFASATYTVANDAGPALLTVNRTGNTSASATVHYATSDGTATAGGDYNSTSGVLSFSAGQTSKTISVPLIANAAAAVSATFNVTLSNVGGNGILGAQTSSTVTETNANSSLQFATASYTVANDAGPAVLTVTRTGNLSSSATVRYATTNDTAIAGTDYTTTTGTLSFFAGQASQGISVPLLPNAAAALFSIFTVTLSNGGGNGVLGAPTTSFVTEQNNNSSLQFAASNYSVVNTTGSADLTVYRMGNVSVSATVHYATSDGTATAGTDYVSASGSLSFSAGQTSKTISVPLLANAAAAASSIFTVALSSAGANGVLGSPATAIVTLQNQRSLIQFPSGGYIFTNTDGGANLTIYRLGDTSQAASVDWSTFNGTALTGVDYTSASGTMNFSPGQSSNAVSVPLVPNAGGAANSAFSVVLANPSGNGVLGAQTNSTVTEHNNNSSIQLAAPTYNAANNATSIDLAVNRTGNIAQPAIVNFSTANGTAHAGTDYSTTSGALSFLAGESSKIITVPIIPQASRYGDTAFSLSLASPGQNTVLGTGASTTVTIAPSPRPPTITIRAFAQMVDPANPAATLHVLADDNGTDAGLTYTWQIIKQPSAPKPHSPGSKVFPPGPLAAFAINGTNPAKNTPVTFLAPGNYTFRVTASNGNLSASSDVQVKARIKANPTPTVATTKVAGVQPICDGSSISGFLVTFNGPLDPTSAQNVAAYPIIRRYFLPVQYPVASAVYNSATNSVLLTLATPMPVQNDRRIVQVLGRGPNAILDANGTALDGDANNKPGGNFAYRFSMSVSKTLSYRASSGDQVKLSLTGPGEIVALIPSAAKTPTIFLTGTTLAKSVLVGHLHKVPGGAGYAELHQLSGASSTTIQLGDEFHVDMYGNV